MSLESEYRKDIESLGDSVERMVSEHEANKLKDFLDQILPIALLTLSFVLVFTWFIPVTKQMSVIIGYLNWGVIVYFAFRLLVELRLSDHREKFVQNHWLDFALVIPAFSVLKQVKFLELVAEAEVLDTEFGLFSGGFFNEASLAAQTTKITRIVKKSVGM